MRYGVIPWTQDENALAVDKVRFIGDPVAAVAAVDEDTANAALKLIEVEYELLHAYLEPVRACRATRARDPRGPQEDGNVSKHVQLDFGDVDAAPLRRRRRRGRGRVLLPRHDPRAPSSRTAPWRAFAPTAC